jgi:hypothetical protein
VFGNRRNKVPATIEGELVMSKIGVPFSVSKTPYVAFSATRVHYEK